MKRGEVWTLQDNGYASKARPVVVVQNDAVNSFDSIVLCLLTTYDSETIATRVVVEPSPENGLNAKSFVMTEKIVTVDKAALGKCIGCLDKNQMVNISKQLAVVLGLE